MNKIFRLVIGSICVLVFYVVFVGNAEAIPVFARKYQTSCTTCHVMPPKLNAFGDAFRMNGYQIPGGDEAFVKDDPVELGAKPWKEMWPDTVWPSTIPGSPIAVRVITDFKATQDEGTKAKTNFEFPHEVELLSGGTLGENIGFFVETEFKQDNDPIMMQALVEFHDVIEKWGVPENAFNIKLGKFDQNYLPSYRNLDRVGKNHPLWMNKKLSDMGGGASASQNTTRLQDYQPGVELNGIIASRFNYGVGIVNGRSDKVSDNNTHKDVYYKLRYKFGGRAYDGTLEGEVEPPVEAKPSGSWVDNAIQLEHFGYLGEASTTSAGGQPQEKWDRFGTALRGTYGNLDVAVGYVFGENDDPWGANSTQSADYKSPFIRADYMFFPWFMGQVRWEQLDIDRPSDLSAVGTVKQTRIIPAAIFLIRANMRLVLEGEIYTDNESADLAGQKEPNTFWTRLDFAF